MRYITDCMHTDPSDAFRRLRDITDLIMLRENGLLKNVRVEDRLTEDVLADIKKSLPHISKVLCEKYTKCVTLTESNPTMF